MRNEEFPPNLPVFTCAGWVGGIPNVSRRSPGFAGEAGIV
jgi:hypothetical protein